MTSNIEIVPMDVADLSRILQEFESELDDEPQSLSTAPPDNNDERIG